MDLTLNILCHVLHTLRLIPLISISSFLFLSSSPNVVSYLVAGRVGCALLVFSFYPWAFQESVNIHHFLILNSKIWDPSAPHVSPSLSAPAFQGPWILPFSFKAKEKRNGWDLMMGAGRCLLCVCWSACMCIRYRAVLSCTCVLPSCMCTYVGQYP